MINNIFESFAPLNISDRDITIYIDTSLTGWDITDGKTPSGGRWEKNEITQINVLEFKAIQFGVLTYCKNKSWKHIRIMSDNTTAISYINKKSGLKSHECNKITKDIWIWCASKDLHISAAHNPDKDNFEADKTSRKFQDVTEGQLNSKIYKTVCDTIVTPEIDLLRINRKTEKYVSWKPEPAVFAVNVFSINWSHHFMYIFSPLILLKKVIKKICPYQATGLFFQRGQHSRGIHRHWSYQAKFQ